MGKPQSIRKKRKRITRLLLGAALLLFGLAGTLWLMVHRTPGWYAPAYVPEVRLDEVRADATRAYNRFGDGLVRRQPFDLVLDERQVSEWIAARERIWPESGGWVPGWVNDPIVRFRDGHILVAARLDLDGRQFIAGAHLRVEVGQDDILVVRLDRVTAGSLPVPLGALAGPLGRLLRLEGRDLDFLPAPVADAARFFRQSEPSAALTRGIRRANRFIWENGHRPYRIAALRIAEGKLTLTIAPL